MRPSAAPLLAEWLRLAVGLLLASLRLPMLMLRRWLPADVACLMALPPAGEPAAAEQEPWRPAGPGPKLPSGCCATCVGLSSCPLAVIAPAGSRAGSAEGISRLVSPVTAWHMRTRGLAGWLPPLPPPGLLCLLLPARLLPADRCPPSAASAACCRCAASSASNTAELTRRKLSAKERPAPPPGLPLLLQLGEACWLLTYWLYTSSDGKEHCAGGSRAAQQHGGHRKAGECELNQAIQPASSNAAERWWATREPPARHRGA